MEVDYYSKYLKYKAKYLELKAQLGGDQKCEVPDCKCSNFEKTDNEQRKCYKRNCYFICKNCEHESRFHKELSSL